MKTKKYIIIALLAIATLSIIGAGGYYYYQKKVAGKTVTDNNAGFTPGVNNPARQETSESSIVPSTDQQLKTEAPVPAGLSGPSGAPQLLNVR